MIETIVLCVLFFGFGFWCGCDYTGWRWETALDEALKRQQNEASPPS